MGSLGVVSLPARRRLARIRCLHESTECFTSGRPLPAALCFVPAELHHAVTAPCTITLFARPATDGEKVKEVTATTNHRVVTRGDTVFNAQGHWGEVVKLLNGSETVVDGTTQPCWILIGSSNRNIKVVATPVDEAEQATTPGSARTNLICSWQQAVEYTYAMHLIPDTRTLARTDDVTMAAYRAPPPNWSPRHDEALVDFLASNTADSDPSGKMTTGKFRDYVKSVEVSSNKSDVASLTSGAAGSYWESSGQTGSHWIRLHMKPGTVIRKLSLMSAANEGRSYIPRKLLVLGGKEGQKLEKLKSVKFERDNSFSDSVSMEIELIGKQSKHIPVIEIKILECQDGGCNTKLAGINLLAGKREEVGLNRDLFTKTAFARWHILQGCDPELVYRRATVLKRIATVLDSVLVYVTPAWDPSQTSPSKSLEMVRYLLPLSNERMSLMDVFMASTSAKHSGEAPNVLINRRSALDHKSDPAADRKYTKSVFTQIYEGLKPKVSSDCILHYRWPASYKQWWKCTFTGEGMVDQGGGFRDSISDLSEELCPSNHEDLLPLPFFIRSPNQNSQDSNIHRDTYVPNPSCIEFPKYEWIGQLMGACMRGNENLVLSLTPFFWKQLTGEKITWDDYLTVDEQTVKTLDKMLTMDNEESFQSHFADTFTWSTVLSDGKTVPIHPDDFGVIHQTEQVLCVGIRKVAYAEREQYAALVKQARLTESNRQVEAIRRGLLSVVPQAALELLTWQELEKRVCGQAEIPIEALRKSVSFAEDCRADDARRKQFWETLEKFSDDDRSHFLRFASGRRRLPVSITVVTTDSVDVFPTAQTCSSAIILPRYSSAKIMEDKLRYAIYHCIAIDTDLDLRD